MTEKNTLYLVLKQHTSNYPNPIKLLEGQKVLVGEKYEGKQEWENWVYCYTIDKCLEGWVPAQIINVHRNRGYIVEDYFAKELDVEVGELLTLHKELNGWFWVERTSNTEEGWIPKENVEKVNKN
ncbi:SH3 domain-containing protein [Alkalihalophilus lindianensis]|uniref:SH3 domain-containing protein n=1 Tax=Alkalihalophilus lindianensis TaxID=1630542 RepID=A0ABU3X4K1_9BACI|nr:SH3 domain-containing protein [Alkalihalophilus lindianensis]MDV2682806.1 SH3 domain-containing protein [Alkalihalophilus lindianensis]